MKKTFFILFVLFAHSILNGQSSSNLWQYVKIPTKVKNDILNVNGLVVNDRGVILAVGYTTEAVDRNAVFPTRVYKMFRSKDNCKTWEDISKYEVQSRLNKMDISPLENTEQYIDQVTAVGNRFYIDFSSGSAIAGHQQDGHFYSDDDGNTWTLGNDGEVFRGNRTFFVNDNTRIDLGYDTWTAKPVFSEIFKKSGSNWKLIYSPTNIIRTNETIVYEDKPPFLIFTGNSVRVFDVAEAPNFGNYSFYFSNYTDPTTNILNTGKFIPCEEPETRKSGNWNCFHLGTALYTSKASNQIMYAITKHEWHESLYRSLDGGRNFSLINSIPDIESVFKVFPTCDDGTIVIGAVRKLPTYDQVLLLFKSSDNGNSWQELGEYPNDFRFVVLTKDGKYLLGGQNGLYLSRNVYCGSGHPLPIGPCSSVQYTTNYQVNLPLIIPQPNKSTCWAACATMMYSWINKEPFSIEGALLRIDGIDVINPTKPGYLNRYLGSDDSKGGINFPCDDSESVYLFNVRMGLIALKSTTKISVIKEYLKQYGAILLLRKDKCEQKPSCPYTSGHANILVGIESDGTENCTLFSVVEPYKWDDKTGVEIPSYEPLNKWTYEHLFRCEYDFFAYPKGARTSITNVNNIQEISSHENTIELNKEAFKTYSCSEQSNLKSTPYNQNNGKNFTTEITFKNNSNETIQTYFIDFEGNKRLYSTILPNGMVSQPTYVNHIWLIADKNNECLQIIDPLKRTKQEVEIKSIKQQYLEVRKSEIQGVEQPSSVRIFNGEFENSTNWSFSGGNVLFKNGTASMQPEKKNVPLKLKHLSFQVSPTANTLEVKLDKSKVGEANFKIMLTDISTMKLEEIYTEKVSQSLTKLNQGLSDFNRTLETGEITIKKKEGKFDIISVDISKYAGKTVSLELSYETLGMGKPALIIDDLSIK